MKKIMIIGLFSLLTGTVGAATFPLFNEQALEGVKTFDASLRTLIWVPEDELGDITLPSEESFKQRANDDFILGLRRDGVTVNVASMNMLFCDVNAAIAESTVVYTVTLNFYDYQFADSEPVHHLLWQDLTLVRAGINKFTPDGVAKVCQDLFAKTWLKWNHK